MNKKQKSPLAGIAIDFLENGFNKREYYGFANQYPMPSEDITEFLFGLQWGEEERKFAYRILGYLQFVNGYGELYERAFLSSYLSDEQLIEVLNEFLITE